MIVVVRFRIASHATEAFLSRVKRQADDSLRLEAACNRFDVARHPTDATQVLLYETYRDAAAFAEHLKSDHFLAFDAETRDWVESKTVERWEGPLA